MDILVVTESKIDNSFPAQQFDIQGYARPFRLDRNKEGGGVLIYIREDIGANVIPNANRLDDYNFEGIFFCS